MELELIEPFLYLAYDEGAADRFAGCLSASLGLDSIRSTIPRSVLGLPGSSPQLLRADRGLNVDDEVLHCASSAP
jgi:hypothetical protein